MVMYPTAILEIAYSIRRKTAMIQLFDYRLKRLSMQLISSVIIVCQLIICKEMFHFSEDTFSGWASRSSVSPIKSWSIPSTKSWKPPVAGLSAGILLFLPFFIDCFIEILFQSFFVHSSIAPFCFVCPLSYKMKELTNRT